MERGLCYEQDLGGTAIMSTKRDRTWLTRYHKERRKNILAEPGLHEFFLISVNNFFLFNLADVGYQLNFGIF